MQQVASLAPLDDADRRRLRDLVDSVGEVVAATRLSCARQTLARALAGLDVHAGTRELIRARLSEVAS